MSGRGSGDGLRDAPDGVGPDRPVGLGGGERAPPHVSWATRTGAAATEIPDGVGLCGQNAPPKVVLTVWV